MKNSTLSFLLLMSAVALAAQAIAAGDADLIVAGGMESMSRAPYLLKNARWGYRLGGDEVIDSMLSEGLTCAMAGCHMGVTAENVAGASGITREAQDAFAAESQRRAEAAISDAVALYRVKGSEVAAERARAVASLPVPGR